MTDHLDEKRSKGSGEVPLRVDSKAASLTREELYRQVWDEPLSSVARRHRVSKTLLKAACQKYCIPMPNAI